MIPYIHAQLQTAIVCGNICNNFNVQQRDPKCHADIKREPNGTRE